MAQGPLLGFERNNNMFSVFSTFNPEFNNPSARLPTHPSSSEGKPAVLESPWVT